MKTKRWEYLVIYLPTNMDQRMGALDEHGIDGWELVAVYFGESAPVAYLKRPA